jgi:ATP-binding cassette subfamily C protein EexD
MIIAGAVLLGRALQPLDLLTNSWKSFADARVAYRRLNGLLKKFPEIPVAMKLPDPEGNISIENIIVTTPVTHIPVLKGVSMQINAGETIGVIGPSASGKSTLARAILGVWPLHSGKVRLDGADVHRWNSVELGPHIGYLPQDIELFEGTVSENISRFGELLPEEVVEAAKIAGVHEMILKLPQGYDTVVGQGGVTLSGGQRQRIGLARALYRKPKIIVLDEPNSNLDEEGDRALLNAILTMKNLGSTIILITHRPTILQVVDKLAVLNQGILTMYGRRDEVLKALQSKPTTKVTQKPRATSVPKMTSPGE